MGARPLARVIQEHIKKPLADEVLFGKLKNGGHVRVVVAKDEDGNDKLGFEYPEGPVTPKQEKLPEPRKNRVKRRAAPRKPRPPRPEGRHAAGRPRLGAEGAAEGVRFSRKQGRLADFAGRFCIAGTHRFCFCAEAAKLRRLRARREPP